MDVNGIAGVPKQAASIPTLITMPFQCSKNSSLRPEAALAWLITTMFVAACSSPQEKQVQPTQKTLATDTISNMQVPPGQLSGGVCQASQFIGFQVPESWGVWTAKDPATIRLKEPISGSIRLRIIAYTLNDKASHELKIRIGDVSKTVTLMPQSATFDLEYSLSHPAQEIVLSGITPRSPQSLKLANDGREIGVGLIKIECAAVNGAAEQN